MNLLDKTIGMFSPQAQLNRMVARAKIKAFNSLSGSGTGYGKHGASYGKKSLLGWITSGMSADEDYVDIP